MKVLVFPEARRAQVEGVIRDAISHVGGTDELTLTVVRMSADWTVHVTGVADGVLAATLCDAIRDALRRAQV